MSSKSNLKALMKQERARRQAEKEREMEMKKKQADPARPKQISPPVEREEDTIDEKENTKEEEVKRDVPLPTSQPKGGVLGGYASSSDDEEGAGERDEEEEKEPPSPISSAGVEDEIVDIQDLHLLLGEEKPDPLPQKKARTSKSDQLFLKVPSATSSLNPEADLLNISASVSQILSISSEEQKKTEEERRILEASQLPLGFFDDPDKDAEAHGIEAPSKKKRRVLERTEAEFRVQMELEEIKNRSVRENIDEERGLDELKDQLEEFKNLKTEFATLKSSIASQRIYKKFEKNEKIEKIEKDEKSEESEEDDDEDFLLDWRGKNL